MDKSNPPKLFHLIRSEDMFAHPFGGILAMCSTWTFSN